MKNHANRAPVIALAVIKGGTGKTTTAAAISQAGRMRGKKVLAVDMDPQGNLSAILGADPRKAGAYEVLNGSEVRAAIQPTPQGIDILAGKLDLSTITPKRGGALRLLEALEPIRAEYDLIIIDTPPAAGELTYNALYAADVLLSPVETDSNGLQGLRNMAALADQLRTRNAGPRIRGTVITRYDGRALINRHMLGLIENSGEAAGFPVYGKIRLGVAIREAQAMRENLFKYAPRTKPAADYMNLFETIEKEIEKSL